MFLFTVFHNKIRQHYIINCNSIIDFFSVCLETLFTIETILKTLCIHCDLNQINIVFHMGTKHGSVDIVVCVCCACFCCSAHMLYGSDELVLFTNCFTFYLFDRS